MGVKSDRYEPKTEKIILTDDTVVFGVQEITGKFDTPAAPTGDGTMIAIQKAIRDALITSGIVVSGSIGRTWTLSDGTDSVTAVQGGTWTVQQGTPPWAVSQSGVWTTGRTWSLGSGTDSVSVPGVATAAKQDTQQARLDLLATEATLNDVKTNTATAATILADIWSDSENAIRAVVETIRATTSTVNSTSTLLGAGASFTGTFESCADFSIISVLVRSDEASATDGLIVEWSHDGVTVIADDFFTIPADEGKIFTFGSYAEFYRVRYVNGATPQGLFVIQTILHPAYCKPSSHRISEPITDDTDAEMVLAAITAKKEDGTYAVVQANNNGSFMVAQTDRPSESRGRVHVDTALEFQTTDQTVHTVTAGKRFFLTTIGIVYLNDSPTAFGRLVIRDGAGGTIKIPYLSGIKSGGSGATATALANPTDFSEPIPFDTSVYVDILAGSITYSIFIIGYEEPI